MGALNHSKHNIVLVVLKMIILLSDLLYFRSTSMHTSLFDPESNLELGRALAIALFIDKGIEVPNHRVTVIIKTRIHVSLFPS